jgi:hypothetical protein
MPSVLVKVDQQIREGFQHVAFRFSVVVDAEFNSIVEPIETIVGAHKKPPEQMVWHPCQHISSGAVRTRAELRVPFPLAVLRRRYPMSSYRHNRPSVVSFNRRPSGVVVAYVFLQ